VNLTLGSTGGVTFGSSITSNTITSAASTALTIQSAGTTAMTIDTSQNVGIGTSSPSNKLDVVTSSPSTGAIIRAYNGDTTATSVAELMTQTGHGEVLQLYSYAGANWINGQSNHPLLFQTNNTERMRIDSSGNLLLNGTTALGTSPSLNLFSANQSQLIFRNTNATSGHYWQMGHNNDSLILYNAANAGVYITYGGTSWTGTSDERLKNITGTIQNGITKVSQLRAAEFTWKNDETNKPQVGLVAQDLQKVLPEVVDEDANGNLGVRYSEVIPLLVAAIQEQQATITALTSRIAALEAK